MRRALLFSLTIFAGCSASVNPQGALNEVSASVNERTGHTLLWNHDVEADKEVTSQVNTLLQSELTIDEAIGVSLLNNQNLQALFAGLGVAQADLVEAGLLRNPYVSLERRFRGKAFEADLTESLLEVFMLPLRERMADAVFETAKLHLTQEILDHIAQVKAAFFTYQSELQLLEMHRQIVKATNASFVAAKALHDAGNISLLELQGDANLLARANLDASEAESRCIEERERLNVLLGASGKNTSWTIAQRLPDIGDEEISGPGLETLAITKRSDLAALRKDLDTEAAAAGIARYEAILPDLGISGHFERDPDGTSSAGPNITLPLPIFNQGQAASAGALAAYTQSVSRYEAMAVEIRSEVRSAYGRMNAARNRAAYLSGEVLPLEQRTIDETQLYYNGMYVGVQELLQAKQMQINTGRDYVETLKDYWLSRVALERSVGGDLRNPKAEVAIPPASGDPVSGIHESRKELKN